MALININFIKKEKVVPPFFVYDLNIVKNQFFKLKKTLPSNCKVFYSVKTNPHSLFLKTVKDLGLGAEITSGGELEKARKTKIPCSKIIFTGPGKTNEDLVAAVKCGVFLIIIESLTEAETIDKIARRLNIVQDILIRVNTRFHINERHSMRSLSGLPTKFGVDEEILLSVVQRIAKLKNLNLRGLHSYPASGVVDYRLLLVHVEQFFVITKRIFGEVKKDFSIIDVGAGLGVNYSNNKNKNCKIEKYGTGLKKLIKKYYLDDKMIILEIGRFLVAESGDYVVKILDVKVSRGVKFVVVDGGINHLSRACVLERGHKMELLTKKKRGSLEKVTVVGSLLYPSDIISNDVFLPSCQRGDCLIIRNTGAYGLTTGMINFSSHDPAAEYFL